MVAHLPHKDGRTVVARELPMPLKHTAVRAAIAGYISTVDVTQQFANPFDEKIEAVYLFPLPEKAAVSEFVMRIGERRIRGILREKEEAAVIYQQARARGHQTSLLVQHRPNIFEQKVANIEPGQVIDIDIRYFHTLKFQDGWYSFVFPNVVGPRYNPPFATDPVHALPGDQYQQPADGTAVRYLRPRERSAHDLSMNVNIDAGVPIVDLRSTHKIDTDRPLPETATVRLAKQTTLPNRDFVLEFRVAGAEIQSNLMTYVPKPASRHADNPSHRQGYFTLMVYPPADLKALPRRAMEMVFVIDCSGSMRGRPLAQAKNAVLIALEALRPSDTFQIIRFSDNASQFGAYPLSATPSNIAQARQYVRRLRGTGGTQMIEGVKTALDFPHDPGRLRFVSFMTDGFIGNDVDIVGAVARHIGDSRIFSFGVGTSVNRYLLERMAKQGRGAVAYLGPNDSAKTTMSAFFERISHPALTDVRIDWGSMNVTDVYPAKLPDVFIGRPVVVTGKFSGRLDDVTVHGTAGSYPTSFRVAASTPDPANANLSKIWARLRIADLMDRKTWQPDFYEEFSAEIRETALAYQLMSDYTSFVAVDASRVTAGSRGTTVHQAVPVPRGTRYDTTVAPR